MSTSTAAPAPSAAEGVRRSQRRTACLQAGTVCAALLVLLAALLLPQH
ncbi:hypothetical protein [Quadrisphaera setariae]|nr:hypothetical protein [Quadrisphaera setariae]